MKKEYIDYAERVLGVRKKLRQLSCEASAGENHWENISPADMYDDVVALFEKTERELDEIIVKYL